MKKNVLPHANKCGLRFAQVSLFSELRIPTGYSGGGLESSKMYFRLARISSAGLMLPSKIRKI